MSNSPFIKFICTACGHRDTPCMHWREMEEEKRWKFVESALCEIVSHQKSTGKEFAEILKKLAQIEAKENILTAEANAILQQLADVIMLLTAPRGMKISQINSTEENMSTAAGGTSVFQEVPTPPGSIFPAGTTFTWTVDDTADISLSPSSDGTQVTATCVASPAGTSYNLTCTSSYTPPGATTPISATINVPITPPPPPTPTGMTINQLS